MRWLEATIFYFLVAYFDPFTSVMASSDRDHFLKSGRHLAGYAADGIAVVFRARIADSDEGS